METETINEYFKLFYSDKYNQNDTLIDNLEKLFILVIDLIDQTEFLYENDEILAEKEKFTFCSLTEKIKIINDFYKHLNIDFNIDDAINNGTIDIKYDNIFDHENFNDELDNILTGDCGIDDHNFKDINLINSSLLADTAVWVHELAHYRNLKSFNETRNLLTESISFTYELIFIDYLKELGYEYENAYLKYHTLENFNNFLFDAYPQIKMHLLYNKMGLINEENYKLYYEENSFEEFLSAFITTLIDDDYDNNINYSLACALSIYMYEKYKENPSFINTIEQFNNSVNSKSLEDCLKIIGLSNLTNEDLLIINKSIQKYIQEIKIYLNQKLIKTNNNYLKLL